MSYLLFILILILLSLLASKIRFRSFYLILFLPTLFWVVGSGTYSGEESKMNISIFLVTLFGVISDLVNFRIFKIEFLAQLYSLLFGLLILTAIKGKALQNIKYTLSRYLQDFYNSKISLIFTFFVFAFSIYKCLVSTKHDIMINSRYFFVEGIYKKKDWSFFESFPRLFTENSYQEDIVFYSFLYINFFYILVLIFLKNKKRMKSILIGIIFILFFPIISIGNNLYNYKDESRRESRALVIYPLVHAINVTVSGFYQDYKLEKMVKEERTYSDGSFHSKYKSLTKIKFYTFFQIITVLLLFPPHLLLKDELKN